MQRPGPAGLLAGGLVELELQDEGQEVTQVRRVARDVEFGAGVERVCGARDRRRDTLILAAEIDPGLVVLRGARLAAEDLPAPLVDLDGEGQEGDLLQRTVHQQADVGGGCRNLVDEAELLEVFRRNREGDEIADGFVEAVIRAVLEEQVLILVGALVEVVAELVVDG